MTLELFLGCLAVLTLAAVIIVALSTQKRVDHTPDDQAWHKDAANRRPSSDDDILK